MAQERGRGAQRVPGRRRAGVAAVVLHNEQFQEEGAGRGGAQPPRGGAGQVRVDVPAHGQGPERQPVAGGAHGRPPHQRPGGTGVGDPDAQFAICHFSKKQAPVLYILLDMHCYL